MNPNSFIADISEIFIRDLNVLAEEVQQTPEKNLWRIVPGINNSIGTLAIHLCGNLRHFIGAVIGKDGYQRNREAEFSGTQIPLEELLKEIFTTRDAVENAFKILTPEQLEEVMPDTPPQHKGRTIGFFLIQLSCHLSRHRGQLDYLRRILSHSE